MAAGDIGNPNQASELGQYFQLKGNYLVRRGLFDEGMEAFLQNMDFPLPKLIT